MNTKIENDEQNRREVEAIKYVRNIKKFYNHILQYLIVILGLFILNLVVSPDKLWVIWVVFGWGFGVLCHGLSVFEVVDIFGSDREKKQIEKRLNKKL